MRTAYKDWKIILQSPTSTQSNITVEMPRDQRIVVVDGGMLIFSSSVNIFLLTFALSKNIIKMILL